MIEQSTVQFGNTKIVFAVQRSARRKTVSLAVGAGGAVTVTAPPHVPIHRLDDVVRAKAPWVMQTVKRASDRPPAPSAVREFVTGETVLFLGRHYRLKITREPSERAVLRAGWLHVPRAAHRADVREAVASWLRGRADSRIPERLDEICMRHGIERPPLVLREPRARWGSCDSRGTLRINWRIVQAPTALIDYVLLHELIHLAHPNHDRAFWSALGRKMPDYEQRRDRLRRLGPTLVW